VDSRELHLHFMLLYIMTLGTAAEYSHLGWAIQLVEQVMEAVVSREQEMGVVMYLQAITINYTVICLHEDKVSFWTDYYMLSPCLTCSRQLRLFGFLQSGITVDIVAVDIFPFHQESGAL
jgi:hypothetical protein